MRFVMGAGPRCTFDDEGWFHGGRGAVCWFCDGRGAVVFPNAGLDGGAPNGEGLLTQLSLPEPQLSLLEPQLLLSKSQLSPVPQFPPPS